MARNEFNNKVVDARPDRLDLRDREYRPPLRSLPPQWPSQKLIDQLLPCYTESGMILNQGAEGACTGFGLAAVINYLIWLENIKIEGEEAICTRENMETLKVSQRMLYNMARVYDEWEGEDYEGSSCRGAMKGWHRHGVCTANAWPYSPDSQSEPDPRWSQEAIQNPLGAYYRINKDSVVDMQAAIKEVGAIYCSATVHEGWWLSKFDSLKLIQYSKKNIGGHAFAIVGYNADGFIVQNSWDKEWGYLGFAVLTYRDWVENGSDAWVAVRGAPVNMTSSPHTFSNSPLQSVAADAQESRSGSIAKALNYDYEHQEVRPWNEAEAYNHSLVIGNDGRPKLTMITAADASASAKIVCHDNIERWLKKSDENKKIVIYAHGGLNSEEDSINRVRIMSPYFKANGIYPLFITWKTGFIESITNQIADAMQNIFHQAGIDPAGTRAKGIFDQWQEPIDRAIERLARKVVVKGVWSEMKENAQFASDRAVPGFSQHGNTQPGAMVILAKALKTLKETYGCEIHLVGHSAGSILFGHWLDELVKRELTVNTITLYAPACTVEFANRHYIRANSKGIFDKEKMAIHMMDDERELSDNVAVYNKSLLYLVSRALEDIHKMPLLGMSAAWESKNTQEKDGKFNSVQQKEMEKWMDFAEESSDKIKFLYGKTDSRVRTSLKGDYTELAHGSFDNDIHIIEQTIKQIKGVQELAFPVENLCGF